MIPVTNISFKAVMDMYQEYLTNSVVTYVDSQNKVIEYKENKSLPRNLNKKNKG